MITAVFTNNSTYASSVSRAWQYDYGQKLAITGLSLDPAPEVHFSLESVGGTSLTRMGVTTDGVTVVSVPDDMLYNDAIASDYMVFAWVYKRDEDSGNTIHAMRIPVKARSAPTDYEGEDPEIIPEIERIFRDAIAAANDAVAQAQEAQSDTAASEVNAKESEINAKASEENAKASEDSAKASEENAKAYQILAESWAVGGTDTRDNEDQDNAKHYAEVAQQGAEQSGYAWFHVNNEDGKAYVTITENLAATTSFRVNTENGVLEVIVNG